MLNYVFKVLFYINIIVGTMVSYYTIVMYLSLITAGYDKFKKTKDWIILKKLIICMVVNFVISLIISNYM